MLLLPQLKHLVNIFEHFSIKNIPFLVYKAFEYLHYGHVPQKRKYVSWTATQKIVFGLFLVADFGKYMKQQLLYVSRYRMR